MIFNNIFFLDELIELFDICINWDGILHYLEW
jgi:hypothetical protein